MTLRRVETIMRNFICALIIVCACAAASFAQHGRLPPSTTPQPSPSPSPRPGDPTAPTLKKPERVDVVPSHARRSYDAAHDTTYVSVDIPLISHTERKLAAGERAFEGRDVTLTFQLAYRGKRTEDLSAAYVVVESTSAPDPAGDHFNGARRLELRADAYQYAYERADYKTGAVEQTGAARQDAQPLRREVAVFRIETADLSEISAANRLEVKLGAETFTVKSPQLTDLRRTLANGDNQ
jgi:hypothetical protein